MKYLLTALILATVIGGGLFLFSPEGKLGGKLIEIANLNASSTDDFVLDFNGDDLPQKPLANPPATIKAVYFTGWSAGSEDRVNYLLNLIKTTELNAVVIDIKDYSGYVLYDINLPEVEGYKAKDIRIAKINTLIKRLHNEGIYVIARISVFQDPILAKNRPDLAIHSKATGGLWLDNKKLAWIDPASQEAWDYNIAIARDAAERGFDEINFDYIRFASDGKISDMSFSFWDGKIPKHETIKNFFSYLRRQLPDVKISADLFGLSTVQSDDLGIGQIIEDAYLYFDFVCPMVYPSHYASGFLNYKSPALYPYEVVKYSIETALKRLDAYNLQLTTASSTTATSTIASTELSVIDGQLPVKVRPWLQDFDLGADYDASMVRKQIQAVYDAARLLTPERSDGGQANTTPELLSGWFLWSPSNVYTKDALQTY